MIEVELLKIFCAALVTVGFLCVVRYLWVL